MTNMRLRKRTDLIVCIVGIALILIWTVIHSFLGIDLVDTGYYYYQYLYPRADNVSYSTYLGTLVGGVWIRIFPSLGLWGLNLLELLLEYVLCGIVFLTFRKTFRVKSIMIAVTMCMLTISTYVNIFNYHQLGMFLCTSMLCAMYTGLRKKQSIWQLVAGACGCFAVFTRFPCILTLVCILCILYWRLVVDHDIKRMVKEVLFFLAGFIIAMGILGGVFYFLGVFDKVVHDVFRIFSLGGSESSTYGTSNQFSNLMTDTLHSVEAAVLFLACSFLMTIACSILTSEFRKNQKVYSYILKAVGAIAVIILCAIGSYYAFYEVGLAPAFAQLTSFSWYIYGMLFVIGAGFSVSGLIAYIHDKKRGNAECSSSDLSAEGQRGNKYRQNAAIGFMGIALVLLCFVGSAGRSKHAILGMWFLVPLTIDWLWDFLEKIRHSEILLGNYITKLGIKVSCLVMGLLFLAAFGWFLARTNNFDDPNLSNLTVEINSDKLRMLKTTEREATATNEVLKELRPYSNPEERLMVIGNSVMLYALTDMPAYVRPWVTGTSYMPEELTEELTIAQSWGGPLPIILWTKTNAYLGFSQENYETLVTSTQTANDKSPKVKLIKSFMEKNKYKKTFENDYYEVWIAKERLK